MKSISRVRRWLDRTFTFLLSVGITLPVLGNMAQPIDFDQFQTISGNPFLSEYVDITHEELNIKIDAQFKIATYKIKYNITSAKDGVQIPLLFIASEYADDFSVSIDGEPISLMAIPQDLKALKGTKYGDFVHIFGEEEDDSYSEKQLTETEFYVTLNNMLYFETDIDAGEHIIEVSYTGNRFTSQTGYVKNYSFRYALSPALYWQSFGTLNLTVDASACQYPIEINVGDPNQGTLDSVNHWQFNEMPVDVLIITYRPQINGAAKFLINIGAQGLAYILVITFFLIHLLVAYRHRLKNSTQKLSRVVIMGSFVVPLVFVLSGFIHNFLMAIALGENAGKQYGAVYFLLAFTYPFLVLVYGFIFWFLDLLIKRVIQKN